MVAAETVFEQVKRVTQIKVCEVEQCRFVGSKRHCGVEAADGTWVRKRPTPLAVVCLHL